MLLRFGFLIATLITIGVNSLSALPLNGVTTAQLSDQWTTLLTPAGFTFSIRGVIYTLLLIVGIAMAIKKITISSRTLYRYIASCVLNSAWIFARHYEQLFLSRAIIIGLWVTIVGMIYHHNQGQKILADTQSPSPVQNRTRLANSVRHIFFFYFGRVSIATLVLTSIIIVYKVPSSIIDPMPWYVGVMILSSILFIRVATKNNTFAHLMVLLWAWYGIFQGYKGYHTLSSGYNLSQEIQDEVILRIVLLVTGCFVVFTIIFAVYDRANHQWSKKKKIG